MQQTARSQSGSRTRHRHASTGPVQPLQKVNLVQEVVDRLRGQILTGQFGPEGRLPPEGELGATFHVSRTVIREAMRTLRAQGLVEVSQGRRPRVRPADPQVAIDSLQALLERSKVSLLHLIEVRRPLEGEIAALAAQRAGPSHVQALEEAICRQADAATLDAQVDADVRFHQILAEASGNPVFRLLLTTLAGLLRKSREETISRTGKPRALSGHRAIFAAVKRHDPAGARAAMLKHLGMAEEDLRASAEAQ